MLKLCSDKVVTVGFDGYVDSILRVKRTEKEFFATLSEFGRYIEGKANRSASLEMHKVTEKLGGNMPIFSLALAKLGAKVSCIGALGYPELHPAFAPLEKACEVQSVCGPGFCQALEFDDGKLMLADNEDIAHLDFDLLRSRVGKDALESLYERCDMLVLLNWSELAGSLSLWNGLEDEVFDRLSDKKRSAFIDLSDCTPRSDADILEAVGLMKKFSKRFDLTVSFNRGEAERVAQAIGVTAETIDALAEALYNAIGCTRLVIHLLDCCYCVFENEVHMQKNRHIEHPVLSTGGGDNFNAGFVYGLLSGENCERCMLLANSVSGFYVSHGHSPDLNELTAWIANE